VQFDRRNSTVEGRAIVLQPGRDLDDLRFDVLGDVEERLVVEFLPRVCGKRPADGDIQRR
jgi:hypothetical protein